MVAVTASLIDTVNTTVAVTAAVAVTDTVRYTTVTATVIVTAESTAAVTAPITLRLPLPLVLPLPLPLGLPLPLSLVKPLCSVAVTAAVAVTDTVRHIMQCAVLYHSVAPQGQLRCWLDLMTPEDARAFPKDDVSLPLAYDFEVRRGRGVLIVMHGRSCTTVDPRIPTIPGRSRPGFLRPGRHCLRLAQSSVRCLLSES